MAFSIVRNAVFLAALFALVFGFGLMWYILPQLTERIYNAANAANPSQPLDKAYLNYLSTKALLIQGFYVLTSMLVLFTLVSSVFDPQTFQGYLFSAIGGLIVTPLIIYIVATYWATFSLVGITFSEISTTFISSFSTIMLVNLFAGLASFIMIRKGRVTAIA